MPPIDPLSAESSPASFRPRQVDAGVFLAPTSVVVGDVTIQAHSSVWYGAVIRGDCEAISIGQRTNVQDGCVLHADPGFPCTLGDGVTVGHGAIVHGATVEENVVIGMRAVVMNGARIGRDSLIGVGAVVTEGVQIPPGSLVLGLPGKVVRRLNEEEIAHNRLSAEHYVAAARQFAAELTARRE